MPLRVRIFAASLSLLALAGEARAQTATQVVRFQVNAVNQVAVSGSPAPAGEAMTNRPLAFVLLSNVTQLKYARPRESNPSAGSLARW